MSFFLGMIAKVTQTLNFSIIPETSNITFKPPSAILLLNLHVNFLCVQSAGSKFTHEKDFVVNLLVNLPGDLQRKLHLGAYVPN